MILKAIKKGIYNYRPASFDAFYIAKELYRKNRELGSRKGTRSNFQYVFKENPHVAPLSWIVQQKGEEVTAEFGKQVETFSNGFFEGVWSGDFKTPSTLFTSIRFGTGLIKASNYFDILPMSNNYEPIFIVRIKKSNALIASNSINFLIAYTRNEYTLDILSQLKDIVHDNHVATARGNLKYSPIVTENGDFVFYRIISDQIRIYSDGLIKLVSSPEPSNFKSFTEYRAFLSSVLNASIENAQSESRRFPLLPLTSITKGYDSTATSVLAFEAGCKQAVAIDVIVHGTQDSGREIAERFGLAVTEYPHIAGKVLDTLQFNYAGELEDAATEFVGTVGQGDDLTFKSLEPAMSKTVFFSGAFGDSIWERETGVIPGLPIRTPYGKSLNEFRLRVGFAHVPVPTIGAMFPRSIVKLSQSQEMKGFSVGGNYDRPIPRRIVEEAGVPRELFGNVKRATAPDSQDRSHLWYGAMEKMIGKYLAALNQE